MSNKYINIDLDDERIGKIADVISNKTCKKILDTLADGEMSGSEIAEKLQIPLNTVGYNIENLIDAGLVEKSSGFLWSEKGRRIIKYKVADKKIVISPKSNFKGILPTVLISGLIALGIKVWSGESGRDLVLTEAEKVASAQLAYSDVPSAGMNSINSLSSMTYSEPALWFFFGSIIALIIVLVLNWRKL